MKRWNEDELFNAALKRRLTDEEEAELQAYLLSNPQAEADWEEEKALGQLLDQVPNTPVSNNFTARVLQMAERERRSKAQADRIPWWKSLFSSAGVRRLAMTAAVLMVGVISYQQYEISSRQELARNVAAVSSVIGVLSPEQGLMTAERASTEEIIPTIEVLENFETIRNLSHVPQKVDFELLAALE